MRMLRDLPGCGQGGRPCGARPRRVPGPCPASKEQGDGVSEAVLERLRKAEEEAAALRSELAAAKGKGQGEGGNGGGLAEDAVQLVRGLGQGKVRVDGRGLNRVVPWAGKNAGDWVSEGDIEDAGVFAKATEAEKAEVKRRVLLGGLAAAALGAFALVPTDSLRLSRPSKPLFLYLVPVVRSQDLLKGLEDVIENNSAGELEAALARVAGPPTSLAENVRNAAIALPEARQRERAEGVARDVLEDLEAIDPNSYFDSPSGRRQARGGDRNRLYADFSLRACRAAQVKVREFLALMPAEDVRAAREFVAREQLE